MADQGTETTRLLLEAATLLAGLKDPLSGLDRVGEVMLRALPHNRTVVYRYDEDAESLVVLSTGGAPVPDVGRAFGLDELTPAARKVLASKRWQVVEVDALPSNDRGITASFDVHNLLAVPLLSRDRALGIVVVDDSDSPARGFSNHEVETVETFAALIATVVDSARLLDVEARAQAALANELSTTRMLLEITGMLSAEYGLEDVLDAIATVLLAATSHRRVSVVLADLRRGTMTMAVSKGGNPVPSGTVLPLERASAPLRDAIATKRRVIADYDQMAEARNRTAQSHDSHLTLIAPIVYHGRVLGVVSVDDPGERCDFSEREIEIIDGLVAQAATAVEAARLRDVERESGERVTTILNSIGDAFFAIDRTWRFTYVNAEAERILQHTAEELLGHGIWELFPEAVGSVFQAEYEQVMETGESTAFEAYYAPFDLWAEVRAYPSADGISVYFTDFSERKAAEVALKSARERADMLAGLLDDSSQPFMVGSPDGRFVLFNRAFEKLTGRSAEELATLTWPDDVTSPATLHAEKDAIAEIQRTGEPQRFEKEFQRKDGTLVPVDVLRHGKPGPDGTIEYYYAFITDISERKAAQAALEAERRRLREVIDDVPMGITIFDAEGCVLEINEANQRIWGGELPTNVSAMEYGAGSVLDREAGTPIEPDEMPAALVIRTHTPAQLTADIVRFDGTKATARFSATPIDGADGNPSRVVLITEDVTSQLESRRLDDALNAIGTALTRTLDSAEILRRLVQLSADALGAETAGLTLTERHGWVMRETYGMPVGSRSALEDPTLETVLYEWGEHAPIVVNDVEHDPRVSASAMAELGIRSLMLLPIVSQHAVVGALVFHHRAEQVSFSAEQVDFATGLMGIATLAFDNARLYERERKIAETLQQAALAPREELTGVRSHVVYRPASHTANIGGDFYNVFSIGPDHVGILIGDVSGKGLEAARLTSLLHDSVRAYAFEEWRPARVVTRVNRLVQHLAAIESFATLFFGVLEPQSGRLVFTTAGHPAPFVVSTRGVRSLVGPRSPIVGAFAEASYGESEIVLWPDEMLVLYTDGITEAHGIDGDLFGEERLAATLQRLRHTSVERMPERVLRGVLRYADNHLRDDTIVLCVKRAAQPSGGASAGR